MRTTEKTLFLLCLMSMILRLMLVPTVIFILLFTAALMLFYAVFGFAIFNDIRFRDIFRRAAYAQIPAMHIVAGVIAGLTLIIPCAGIMLTFLYWPDTLLLWLGLVPCLAIWIVCLIKMKKGDGAFYRRILQRVIIAGGICLLLLLIPGRSFKMFMYRNQPKYMKAAKDASEHPDDPYYRAQEEKVFKKMFGE